MALDASLLQNLSEPILHLYEMEGKAATYGWFTKPETLVDLEQCAQEGIQLAKRPTGGGIIFHFLDLAFSYLIPKGHPHFSENTLENYRTVNGLVMEGLKSLLPEHSFSFIEPSEKTVSTFCMAHPTPFDLLCNGKKMVGAAQRKTKLGFLHQGSISILAPNELILKKIVCEPVAKEIVNNSFYLTNNPRELGEIRKLLRAQLIKKFVE